MNNVRVFMLMAALTALLMAVGGAIGGQSGMIIALVLAAGTNFFAFFASDKMVLRAYRAQIVSEKEAPELYRMVDRLRQNAGLPMPTVAIAPHAQPNAFATGRSPERAVVCVTQGLTQLINEEEMEGVIAHELAHIKNRDMLLQTFTATIAGAISNLAFFGYFMGGRNGQSNPMVQLAMMILAPLAAAMVQMAISRQREFKADAVGAEICGRPLALASALQKLEAGAKRIPMQISPAVAPVAQVNPLAAHGGGFAKLFSTHPPMAERVRKLQELAARRA